MQVEKFNPHALEQFAIIIGDRYTGSQLTDFFRKAGYPQYKHDGTTKWRFVLTVLEQIQNNSIEGNLKVARILEIFCDKQAFFGDADQFDKTVKQLNEVLGFYSLAINSDGRIIQTGSKISKLNSKVAEVAKVFDSRNYHPEIKKHGRPLFTEGRYFHAVFECCKAFDKYVRTKSHIEKHGSELMGTALSIKGSLKLNTQRTETERNEQEGLMNLCIGLMRAIRNPESHEPELDWPINQEDALDILSLVSFLYREIDKTVYFATS